MKPLYRSFAMFIKQIFKDSMLFMVCIAVVLTAFFIRFGIPAAEKFLCSYFNKEAILLNYYLLCDLFLALMTPYMFCFASALMMLTEYDENIASFLAVTPVGKKGYVISRLIFPAGIAFIVSVIILSIFSLTEWSVWMIIIICLLTSVSSVIITLFLFSFSHNRVEGMALGKLSGILMLGLPVPFFLTNKFQYLFSFLPSFWIAKLCISENGIYLLLALATSVIWISIIYKKFSRKMI